MFYIVEKNDPANGEFSYVPVQVASNWSEAGELIAGLEGADPINVSLGVSHVDLVQNVFRFASVATPNGFSEYRVTELRRS